MYHSINVCTSIKNDFNTCIYSKTGFNWLNWSLNIGVVLVDSSKWTLISYSITIFKFVGQYTRFEISQIYKLLISYRLWHCFLFQILAIKLTGINISLFENLLDLKAFRELHFSHTLYGFTEFIRLNNNTLYYNVASCISV